VRGVLLWLVVPVAICVWLILSVRLGRRGVGVGQFVGWVDLNLIACLERGALRPLVSSPAKWMSWSEMALVTHRVRWLDPD
jgi:hypothetical protein